jgi:superfamily II DNA/RNA helicase
MAKNRIEKKRKRKEADSESDEENQQNHDKKLKSKQTNRNINQIAKRNPVAWTMTFRRNFWTGTPPSAVISDELKLKRKELGILAKGSLHLCPHPVISFDDHSFPQSFHKVLQKSNIVTPTPIQMQCIPAILNGCNVLGISPTGSGKTLAYLLPMIPHLQHHMTHTISRSSTPSPLVLILVPTRELALQVVSSCKVLKSLYQMKSLAVYGGIDKKEQTEKLQDFPTTEIIVATPGRLLDLMSSNDLILDHVTYLVIDEADRMLALGFEEQLNTINGFIRPDRQTILFTATFPGKLRESSTKWMGEVNMTTDGAVGRAESEFQQTVIVRVNTMELKGRKQSNEVTTTTSTKTVTPTAASSTTEEKNAENNEVDEHPAGAHSVSEDQEFSSHEIPSVQSQSSRASLSLTLNPAIVQHVHVCASHKKPRLLLNYLIRIRQTERDHRVRQPEPMMIFCSKIKTINFLLKLLKKHNHTGVNILHGQLTQQNREIILNDFKAVGYFITLSSLHRSHLSL